MPEDDGPTMTGAPGEPRLDHALPPLDPEDADDTTTAEAGPPASRRDDTAHDGIPDSSYAPGLATQPSATDLGPPPDLRDPSRTDAGEHANEDRTVQQKVGPPSRPPAPQPAAGAPAPSSPLPSTEPRGAVAPITQTNEMDSTDITDELADDLSDDADPLDDSITATAPRLDHANLMDAARAGVPVVIPGTIEIRTVDNEDDSLDETEIRTLPGTSPLQVPPTLRDVAPAPRPAAGMPPPSRENRENDDDGITTRAIAPAMAAGPVSKAPATRPSGPSTAGAIPRAASPRPAAGMPFRPEVAHEPATRPGAPNAATPLEAGDEPATRPGVEGADEPATRPGTGEPPTRPGAPDPETAERLKRVEVAKGYANEDDDESVTARSKVPETYDEEESVTTQAPAVPSSVIEAAISTSPKGVADAMLDDGTDGTTQRVKKTREAALSSPADSEAESITTQAPGNLTNILRVIASGSSPGLEKDAALPSLDDDEPPENRTAVMANAPLKRVIAELASQSALPAIRPTGGPLVHGAAAPRLEPSSESGLRVARSAEVERASLGALGIAGDRNGRSSGIGPHANALASDGSISGSRDRAHDGIFPARVQPSVHDVDLGKGPRYGLLVAIVGVISIAVPVTLFYFLHHSSDGPGPIGTPAEPASEIEKHDGTRIKGVRGKNGQLVAPSASVAASAAPSSSPSASPSSSSSAKPGGRGFPFRR